MAGSRKGQIAIEFLMYSGLFLIIAIGAYVLTSFTERGEVSLRESQLIDAFGYKFASAPTIAYKGGEGLTYDISFAKKLDNRPYNVTYACTDGGSRSCYVQIAWRGTYQEFNYPYVIAPAIYKKGEGAGSSDCIEDISSSSAVDLALRVDSEDTDGHLMFHNTGIQPGDEYPTIELYCEVNQ
ncbi:MAG: hypothetical protein ACLFUZ_00595 [Candidatus Micrarchaeia archaeon]